MDTAQQNPPPNCFENNEHFVLALRGTLSRFPLFIESAILDQGVVNIPPSALWSSSHHDWEFPCSDIRVIANERYKSGFMVQCGFGSGDQRNQCDGMD